MNRKLLVIAMVPLLVGFAGAMAFSSWSGTITKTITVSTATVTVTEKVECVGAYIAGTVKVDGSWSVGGGTPVTFGPILLDGDGHGHVSSCPVVKHCEGSEGWDSAGIIALDGSDDGCGDPGSFSLGSVEFLGDGVSGATYNLNVYGLAPGDWIDLEMLESVHISDDGPPVTFTASLTPSALYGVVSYPALTFAGGGLGYTQAPAGGWTYLDPPPNYCEQNYNLVGTGGVLQPINVGPTLTPAKSLGLVYCDSGPLAPGAPTAPSGPGLSPVAGPHTYDPSYLTVFGAYILFGLDGSATVSDMGISGASLTYTTTATAP